MVLDRPEAMEALEFYVDLAKVHRIAPLPNHPILRGTNYNDLFGNGQAAMIPQTRFHQPGEQIDWDLAHLPYSKERASSLITNFYSVVNGTNHPEESWRLLRFHLGRAARR